MGSNVIDITKRIKERKEEAETDWYCRDDTGTDLDDMDEDLVAAIEYAEDLSMITFESIIGILEDEKLIPKGVYKIENPED